MKLAPYLTAYVNIIIGSVTERLFNVFCGVLEITRLCVIAAVIATSPAFRQLQYAMQAE